MTTSEYKANVKLSDYFIIINYIRMIYRHRHGWVEEESFYFSVLNATFRRNSWEMKQIHLKKFNFQLELVLGTMSELLPVKCSTRRLNMFYG